MYFVPRRYECPKCGNEADHTQSDNYRFWPENKDGYPYCLLCFDKFLAEHVPTMQLK